MLCHLLHQALDFLSEVPPLPVQSRQESSSFKEISWTCSSSPPHPPTGPAALGVLSHPLGTCLPWLPVSLPAANAPQSSQAQLMHFPSEEAYQRPIRWLSVSDIISCCPAEASQALHHPLVLSASPALRNLCWPLPSFGSTALCASAFASSPLLSAQPHY